MPSEHRLHPASILFALVGSLKAFALPALLLFFSSLRSSPAAGGGPGPGGRAGGSTAGCPANFELDNWQAWLLLLLIPADRRRHRPLS